jgi:hypothetical protein
MCQDCSDYHLLTPVKKVTLVARLFISGVGHSSAMVVQNVVTPANIKQTRAREERA